MKRLTHFVTLLSYVVVLILTPFSIATTQGNDCGNGLVQRLQVGGRGWINLEPPLLRTRVRNMPSGDTIVYIDPGTEFEILSGPVCNSIGTSWWEIETDDGIVGWIPEGDENGYYVDPLETESISADCLDSPPSQLRAGQTVRILNPEEAYTYVLFEGETNWDQGDSIRDFYSMHREIVSDDLVLAEGPICSTGGYLWRALKANDEWRTPGGYSSRWIHETYNGQYVLETVAAQPAEISETYEPLNVRLLPASSAPIVDVFTQLLPMPGGGAVSDRRSFVFVGSSGQMSLIFPPHFNVGSTVEISLYRPDGSVYDRTTETIPTWSRIVYNRPSLPGLHLGTWTIEAISVEGNRKTWAYSLQEYEVPQLWPNNARFYEELVIGTDPVFALTGFTPYSSVELVLAAYDENINELRESYRWKIVVGSHGDAVLQPESIPYDNYYLVVADENGQWLHRYYATEELDYSGGRGGESNFVSRLSR